MGGLIWRISSRAAVAAGVIYLLNFHQMNKYE